MKESGYYPPGAEFDSRAPYNQVEEDLPETDLSIYVSYCIGKNVTVSTSDYIIYKDSEGTAKLQKDFTNTDFNKAYLADNLSIPQLLDVLKDYVSADLQGKPLHKRKEDLNRILNSCIGWEIEDSCIIKN